MPTENVGALGAAQGCESGQIINKVEGKKSEGETDVAGLSMAYKQHTECL